MAERLLPITEPACCFCGDTADEPIDLIANWMQNDEPKSQVWAAHRSCLMQRMGDHTREARGPLFEL